MNTCPQCGDPNPKEARFCQSCGTALGVAESAVPKEVRKTVSIVFCDLKGAPLGESIDPETLRRVVARYFNDMKATLERHGGTVEKFIGDAIMAAFGVPVLHEDDSLRAVRAAEEMQKAMATLNEDIELEFGVTLAAHIGINTGEVIAGDASAGHGFVSGDAVNVAARLEQAAGPGEVLMGEPTYRLVRDAVKVEPVEPLALKGKSEPMPAYRLLEVIPHVLGSSRRLDSPLVARDKELAQLEKTFEDAITTTSTRLLTILGNAGAGKSRLAADFIEAAAEKARVISGRCLPYGEGITFWPVAEAIKELCSITEEGSSDQAIEKIAGLMPEGEEGRLVADRIAGAIGLAGSTPDTQETFWAIRKLFEQLGKDQPLLLVFDDIHWAEPTMLDLIEYLGNFIQGVAAMLLCVSRRELLDSRPSWGGGGQTLALEPLGEEAVSTLIANLLGRSQLPDVVQAKIIAASEGNPLYVEEILRMLIDDGLLLQQVDGHWAPEGDLSNISIPPTISALLTARLDRLNTNEQGVIQRGSVIGKEFWWGAVTELSPDSLKPHVGGHLQMLARKELIRPHTSTFAGEDAFRFSHIMIRDAAYQGMPKELRGEWHEQFAGWLEEKAGDRAREYEEILGYHLEQAFRLREDLGMVDDRVRELGAQAAEKLGSAGGRAFLRADMPAAANLLSRATALLPPKDPTRLELSLDLADALKELGEVRRAATVLDQIERAAAAIPDERLEARARLQHLILRSSTGEGEWDSDATRLAPELMEVFGTHGDELGLARAHLLLAEVHWDNMDHAGTDAELEEALKHARLGGREHEEARILSWLSSSQFWGPTHVDVAIARCEELLIESKGNRIVEARTMLRIAGLQAMRGRIEQARILVATSRAINADLGQASSLATSAQEAGLVEMMAGDLAAAEREFRAGYDRSLAMGENAFAATAAAMLSEALYAQKRFDEAYEFTVTSEKLGADRSEWAPTRAKVLARRGELEEAVQMARDAVIEASETDDLRLRGDTFMALAEVLFVAGMRDDAKIFVEKALALYDAKGIASSIERARSLLEALAR